MYQSLGLENMALSAVVGTASGMVGTLGIKAVFAIQKFRKAREKRLHPPAPLPASAAAPDAAHPATPKPAPPKPSRETWAKYGYAPAIVGADIIGGFTGRWPPLSEMGRLGNMMTWMTGIGYGLIYGIAITPWIQAPVLVALVLFYAIVMLADYGLLVPWGVFKPPWKEGHAFYFNLMLYGVYCILTVAAFWAISRVL